MLNWTCEDCGRNNDSGVSCRFCGAPHIIYVVHKRPLFDAEVLQIRSDLQAFQALLDGGYLESVDCGQGVHMYIDEEGKLKGLPPNGMAAGEVFVGPAVFSRGDEQGRDIGFSEEDAMSFCQFINQCEAI